MGIRVPKIAMNPTDSQSLAARLKNTVEDAMSKEPVKSSLRPTARVILRCRDETPPPYFIARSYTRCRLSLIGSASPDATAACNGKLGLRSISLPTAIRSQ